MKNQPKYSSPGTIAETFRSLRLDDPELRSRLRGFSKPGIWPSQVERRSSKLVTRNNTAPDQGDDNAQLESTI